MPLSTGLRTWCALSLAWLRVTVRVCVNCIHKHKPNGKKWSLLLMMKWFLYHFSGISLNEFFLLLFVLFGDCFFVWKLRNGMHIENSGFAITFNELLVLYAVKHGIAVLFLIMRLLHENGFYSSFHRSSLQYAALLISGIYLIASRLKFITKKTFTLF